jgi:beta-galactosidase
MSIQQTIIEDRRRRLRRVNGLRPAWLAGFVGLLSITAECNGSESCANVGQAFPPDATNVWLESLTYDRQTHPATRGSAATADDRNVFKEGSFDNVPIDPGGIAGRWGLGHPAQRQTSENEADAALPSGEKLTWGQEPLEVVSSRREEICLNGIWQFVPVLDASETRPPGGLAYIRVPGSWQSGFVSERGRGPAWRRWGTGTAKSAVWYQRQVKIPGHWAGRAVILGLQRVSTDASVYVNGTNCGGISWPAGELDISKAIKPGADAILCIQVQATTEGTNRMFLDPGRVVSRAAALESKGLIGDVIISSRPKGAHISDVFVQTSTRKKELKLDIELAGVPAAGRVQFDARVFDRDGNEAKRFTAAADVDRRNLQTLPLSWTWNDPALWDVQQPNLYTLKLKASGAGVDDEYAQRFGFREFWIDRRKLFLNGTEIHLRPTCHTYMEVMMSGVSQLIDAHIDGLTRAGFNIEEMWPVNHDERGKRIYRELWADRADRKGFLLLGTAVNLNQGQWHRSGYQELWQKTLEQELRRYRNHPSIVIWTTNPNWLGHGLDQDPHYIGRNRAIADAGWKERAAIAREGNAAIKKLDPTRPVLNHAGSSIGDVYNINAYLNFMPLQEREEWLSEWSKSGDMPLLCVEFGTPWKYSFLRGRWGMQAGRSEPFVTEYCATYLGTEAYALETADYRRAIRAKFQGGMAYREWDQDPVVDFSPAYQRLQALFSRNTFRSWRTWGISGGMVP